MKITVWCEGASWKIICQKSRNPAELKASSQICTGGGTFGLTELKRSSSSSSANRLCAAGFATLGLEL